MRQPKAQQDSVALDVRMLRNEAEDGDDEEECLGVCAAEDTKCTPHPLNNAALPAIPSNAQLPGSIKYCVLCASCHQDFHFWTISAVSGATSSRQSSGFTSQLDLSFFVSRSGILIHRCDHSRPK